MSFRRCLLLLALTGLGIAPAVRAAAPPPAPAPLAAVTIFKADNVYFFQGDSLPPLNGAEVVSRDNGRVVERTVDLGAAFQRPGRIVARVTIHPIPKNEDIVFDRWDRAGSVRLAPPGQPEVELVKFMTSFGGTTEHEVDVTELAPLLQGSVTFRAFIDTWLRPAWTVDFQLRLERADDAPRPVWVQPLFLVDEVTRTMTDAGPLTAAFTVPPGLGRVTLRYLVSGHCTDGRDDDEFVQKQNVIGVDGREAHRFAPWRDDCRQFRALNPYTHRWSDGTWSSDYSRSGWCPGDWVRPTLIDLTGSLPVGHHTIDATVENIRPRGADGYYGYWRISACLVGWR